MSYGKDFAAVVRGCRLVGRAIVREQVRQCEQRWETGSLKPLSEAALKKLSEVSQQATNIENLQKLTTDVTSRGRVFAEGIFKGLPVTIFGQAPSTSTDDLGEHVPSSDDVGGPDVLTKENGVQKFSFDIVDDADVITDKIKISQSQQVSEEMIEPPTGTVSTSPTVEETKRIVEESENVQETFAQTKPAQETRMFEKQKLNETSKQRRVPSSRIGRLASYGNLAVGLGFGALTEVTKRSLGLSNTSQSGAMLDQNPFLTEENAERIVNTLCRVRGAALKLGQMLSIQDSTLINPQLQKIFERVRYGADFMPTKQLEKVIRGELGDDWRSLFSSFDDTPIAAASIGQVHSAILKDGREVAIKVQYPGVAEGIESDIKNLVSVMTFGNVLPKGLYLDSLVRVAREELAFECDYLREAQASKRFKLLVADDPSYYVPFVVDELTTKQIFTSELIYGLPLDKCLALDQETRNWLRASTNQFDKIQIFHISQSSVLNWLSNDVQFNTVAFTQVAMTPLQKLGEKILWLCLRELFVFRFMQTDPNWSNFFYDAQSKRIVLLDFGATRDFGKKFTDQYMKIIKAAADQDRRTILEYSRKIGFLTGYESKVMEEAHCDAVMILGEAFAAKEPLDFGTQNTTKRIQEIVPVMIKHRLTPPPEEIYSLHRKLSGAFLLCAKLKARIDCRLLFNDVYRNYKFDTL